MPKGTFITFEGIDGSGKTTQVRMLAQRLESQGLSVLTTRQPGGTQTGGHIRALLLDAKTTALSPCCEMGLMFADRAQALVEIIQPAIEAGKVVLCDRYTDSTEAYQGGGRQLGSSMILDLHRLLCQDIWPDLTIFLLPEFKSSMKRARSREWGPGVDESRFEREHDDFYHRVFDKYCEIADREQNRVVVISCNGSMSEVHEEIVNIVLPILSSHIASTSRLEKVIEIESRDPILAFRV
jgi:dTMP kinase